MRLDLTQASVETIYVTIWASSNVSLHMGKTDNADEIRTKHFGIRLQVGFFFLFPPFVAVNPLFCYRYVIMHSYFVFNQTLSLSETYQDPFLCLGV